MRYTVRVFFPWSVPVSTEVAAATEADGVPVVDTTAEAEALAYELVARLLSNRGPMN